MAATKLKIGQIDAGLSASLDVFTSSDKGVAPASGGGTTNYLRADGTWAAPAGVGTVTSVAATAPAAGFTIAGSPITGAGTLTFTLADDLAALEGLASTGIAARTAANTWAVRTITGTANQITVADGDGVAANPTLSLPTTVIAPGSLQATTSLIARSSTATHGYINLQPGTATESGYIEVRAHTSGTRQGYLAHSDSNGAADAGTLNYVAGTHAFAGYAYFDAAGGEFNGYLSLLGGVEATGQLTINNSATPGLVIANTGATQQYSVGYNDASNVFLFYDLTAAATRLQIADTTGQVSLPSNIASTSTTTGTLIVTGGVGVSGRTTSNNMRTTATTASTSTTTGAIVNTGGLGNAGNIYSGGNIRLTGTTSVLGYDTGSGGAVTQATSKATGVTINKGCGAITMHNANLATNTTVSFVVTNSTVAARDTVIVNVQSVGTVGAYIVVVDAVAAGSFTVSVRNITAGTLGEAIVLNFAVIKAVNA